MQKELGFGAGVQSLNIPDQNLLGVSLKEIVKPGKKIATTSDITLVFALGSHRKHTPEKQKNWQANMPSTKLPASTAMQMTACTSL